MEYVPLGTTGLEVSRVGFGCATLGGYDYGVADDEVSIEAVRRAVDLGVTFFDVADVYGLGRAEALLRRALGPRLMDVVVATKFGVRWSADGRTSKDISPARLREALEGSLTRLGLEQIPLYQIHWPDGRTRWEDCMAELEQCRAEGKVRFAGACNVSASDVDACQRAGRLESLQLPFSLAERGHGAWMRAARDVWGMSRLAYNVLAHGMFSGRYSASTTFTGTDLRTRVPLLQEPERSRVFALLDRIREVAGLAGRTPSQVAIRWALEQPSVDVTLVGTRTAAQIDESARAVGWPWLPEYDVMLEAGAA